MARAAALLIPTLLALAVVSAPFVMAGWFALCPEYGDPGCPGGAIPVVLRDYRTASYAWLQLFLIVNLVAPYIYPISYIGLGLAALRRSTWLATLGMVIGWIGSVPFGYFADQEGFITAMSRLRFDSQFTALVTQYMHDPHLVAIAGGWVIGHLLGYVLLGMALLRSNLIWRWAAVALIVAPILMGPLAYGTGLGVLQVLGYVLVGLASFPVAGILLRDASTFNVKHLSAGRPSGHEADAPQDSDRVRPGPQQPAGPSTL
jgi:hypothetical protein